MTLASVAKSLNVLLSNTYSLKCEENAQFRSTFQNLLTPADTYSKLDLLDFGHCNLICILTE